MSSAPLDRDQQMELMTCASDRFDALLSELENDVTVKALMVKPHPALSAGSDYMRHDEKLAIAS